jgi:hypothetical protein
MSAIAKKKSVKKKTKDGLDERKRIWVAMDAETTSHLARVKDEVSAKIPAFFRGRALSDSAIICGLINQAYEDCASGKFSVDGYTGSEPE